MTRQSGEQQSVAATDVFFFFNDTATTEIYTLSLHDALPIYPDDPSRARGTGRARTDAKWLKRTRTRTSRRRRDRKSTRLNSSHANISYAVFCLKKNEKHRAHRHPHGLPLCDQSPDTPTGPVP